MRMLFVASLFFLLPTAALTQRSSEIVGTWFGASLCADKTTDLKCKDEVVLYRFRPDSAAAKQVLLDAWKIVGRDTLHMGTLTFVPSTTPQSWECNLQSVNYRGLWAFTVSGNALAGTLIDQPSKRLVRRVVAERVTP